MLLRQRTRWTEPRSATTSTTSTTTTATHAAHVTTVKWHRSGVCPVFPFITKHPPWGLAPSKVKKRIPVILCIAYRLVELCKHRHFPNCCPLYCAFPHIRGSVKCRCISVASQHSANTDIRAASRRLQRFFYQIEASSGLPPETYGGWLEALKMSLFAELPPCAWLTSQRPFLPAPRPNHGPSSERSCAMGLVCAAHSLPASGDVRTRAQAAYRLSSMAPGLALGSIGLAIIAFERAPVLIFIACCELYMGRVLYGAIWLPFAFEVKSPRNRESKCARSAHRRDKEPRSHTQDEPFPSRSRTRMGGRLDGQQLARPSFALAAFKHRVAPGLFGGRASAGPASGPRSASRLAATRSTQAPPRRSCTWPKHQRAGARAGGAVDFGPFAWLSRFPWLSWLPLWLLSLPLQARSR